MQTYFRVSINTSTTNISSEVKPRLLCSLLENRSGVRAGFITWVPCHLSYISTPNPQKLLTKLKKKTVNEYINGSFPLILKVKEVENEIFCLVVTHLMMTFRIRGTVSPLSQDSLLPAQHNFMFDQFVLSLYHYNKHSLVWSIWIKHGSRKKRVYVTVTTSWICGMYMSMNVTA